MRSPRAGTTVLIGLIALAGCSSATAGPSDAPPSGSSRNVQISATFTTTPGQAVTYDEALVPAGARGAVSSTSAGGNTTVMLAVRGLLPGRAYGAHAHAETCGASGVEAGPHFQHVVDPVQPSVDPGYANAENEIWLDLTMDATGAGSARTTVPWAFGADRRARSVVLHALPTATGAGEAGTAGDRVACISVDF